MTRGANFIVEVDSSDALVLRDVGPHHRHQTITNDAEGVVARVASVLGRRRLFYIDSDGRLDELVVANGAFVRFQPGVPAHLDHLRELAGVQS